MEFQRTATHAAGKARKEWWGIPVDGIWIFLGGLGATLLLLILLYGLANHSLGTAMFWGVQPLYWSVVYVLTLKRNRPERYDLDFIESVLCRMGLETIDFGPKRHRLIHPLVEASEEKA